MSRPPLAIFDDDAGRWGPLTDRRPVFDLRSGAHTTRERIERALGSAERLIVPARLAEVTAERHSPIAVNTPLNAGHWLLVNGRWPALADAPRLAALPADHALLQADGSIVAAHLPADVAQQLIEARFLDLPAQVQTQRLETDALLARPWHLLHALEPALQADLAASALPDVRDDPPTGMHIVGAHPVRIAPDATVLPAVVVNVEKGPVVIDHGARIEPFAALEGPCYIGRRSHLAAHTMLRAGTSIGPHCKVGGEIKHAIIQGHSNKAHLGYLGDAIVGQWCNLGADTNVSNLKNTYGPVRVQLEPNEPPEDTGRTNHGPIIGDFVRTAIGSRLLTGSVVATGCMLALSSFVPKHVPRFTFCTDAGASIHDLPALLATAERMMQAHAVHLTDAEADLLRELHTRATAQLA
ncbi:MAG: putative sugar nucleotidyl transferase [Phycisphaeraceae bacterium]